jgi:hypothetical protein
MDIKDYYCHDGTPYIPFNCRRFDSIEQLEFLKGRQMNEDALVFIHCIRPSSIRITHRKTTVDFKLWRVTVYVDDLNIITKVEQEVEIGIPKAKSEKIYGELMGKD